MNFIRREQWIGRTQLILQKMVYIGIEKQELFSLVCKKKMEKVDIEEDVDSIVYVIQTKQVQFGVTMRFQMKADIVFFHNFQMPATNVDCVSLLILR